HSGGKGAEPPAVAVAQFAGAGNDDLAWADRADAGHLGLQLVGDRVHDDPAAQVAGGTLVANNRRDRRLVGAGPLHLGVLRVDPDISRADVADVGGDDADPARRAARRVRNLVR